MLLSKKKELTSSTCNKMHKQILYLKSQTKESSYFIIPFYMKFGGSKNSLHIYRERKLICTI